MLNDLKDTKKPAGTSFAPGHITCFFTIHMGRSSLTSGSTGAGLCLREGVTTEVWIERGERAELTLFFNGVQHSSPTCNSIFRMLTDRVPVKVLARQTSRLVPGYGYGLSGASALSLGLAIDRALGLGISTEMIGQLAHAAEVENLTGLGDVIAQLAGGYELRERPGAPGVGRVQRLEMGDGHLIVTSPAMSFPTSNMITGDLAEKINVLGREALTSFSRSMDVKSLAAESRRFWERVGILNNEKVRNVLNLFEKAGIENPSVKKGVVFGLVPREDLPRVASFLAPGSPLQKTGTGEYASFTPVINDPQSGIRLIISEISKGGAC